MLLKPRVGPDAERQALGHIQPPLAVGLDVLPEQGVTRESVPQPTARST
ncbi:hypothetical protein AB0C84_46020 [Actinomadura sp. NPDC048955]